MTRTHSMRLLFGAVSILLLFPAATSADGKFFRRLEVADEPGIAAQRAVVAFRDGVETLIVQSDIENAGESIGWVLPLPAEPTSIEACPPVTLSALTKIVRPEFAKPKTRLMVFFLALMGLTIYACLDHVHCAKHSIKRGHLISLVALFILIMISMFMVPSLMGIRPTVGDIEIIQTTKAGVYDVSIIKADEAGIVTEWLTSNGFACPPSAQPIIADYIKDNWFFLAAKVSSEATGEVTHHPLRVSFPTSQAIYPIRLTGSDGAPIQLDLFVISEQRAAGVGMKAWVCERMHSYREYRSFEKYAHSHPPIYKAQGLLSPPVGLNGISDLMWPNCTLTRLHGRLSPSDMQSDLTLSWQPLPKRPIRLHNRESALTLSGIVFAAIVILVFPFSVNPAVKHNWSWTTLARKRLSVVFLLAIFGGAFCYAWLDATPVRAQSSAFYPMFATSAHEDVLKKLSDGLGDESFIETYQRTVEVTNAQDDVRMVAELEKPGDYKINATSNGWDLAILDINYITTTIHISSSGLPELASAE